MQIREDVPLEGLTTLRVGGPARYFIEAESEDDVARAVSFAEERALPLFVLGGGSNVLVADEGYEGVVLRVLLRGVSAREAAGDADVLEGAEGAAGTAEAAAGTARRARALLEVAAGEPWDPFVAWCVARGFSGIECLSGIPGLAGATPIQNVGAYGQDVSQTVGAVKVFDRRSGAVDRLAPEACRFAYRSSAFNTDERDRFIVLSVLFVLERGGAPALGYHELRRRFAPGSEPGLGAVREAVLEIRRSKGMLLTEGDPESRSAGSFFKNPVVDDERYRRIAESEGLEPPAFSMDEGKKKIPAAWLIERSGIQRGMTHGGAGVSTRHALSLVNRGDATARDLIDLAADIRRFVFERFGITLELEPVLLGFAI